MPVQTQVSVTFSVHCLVDFPASIIGAADLEGFGLWCICHAALDS